MNKIYLSLNFLIEKHELLIFLNEKTNEKQKCVV